MPASEEQIHHRNIERLLLQELQSGKSEAFREFVRLYQRRLFALAMQLAGNTDDAEDLVQETFIKAYNSIQSFQGTSALYTWLHRILVNLYIDFTRSGRYRTMTVWNEERDSTTEEAHFQQPYISPEASADAHVRRKHIHLALQTLSPQQRTVFVLRYFQDLSLEEVADEIGVSTGTVKTLIFRAVRQLRQRLSFYRDDMVRFEHATPEQTKSKNTLEVDNNSVG